MVNSRLAFCFWITAINKPAIKGIIKYSGLPQKIMIDNKYAIMTHIKVSDKIFFISDRLRFGLAAVSR